MTGAELIAAERRRQVEEEGFTAEHDDQHDDQSLAWAAVCYAAPERVYLLEDGSPDEFTFIDLWPPTWGPELDKRPIGFVRNHERIRYLTKAGALIAAEIDRLLRLEAEQER